MSFCLDRAGREKRFFRLHKALKEVICICMANNYYPINRNFLSIKKDKRSIIRYKLSSLCISRICNSSFCTIGGTGIKQDYVIKINESNCFIWSFDALTFFPLVSSRFVSFAFQFPHMKWKTVANFSAVLTGTTIEITRNDFRMKIDTFRNYNFHFTEYTMSSWWWESNLLKLKYF